LSVKIKVAIAMPISVRSAGVLVALLLPLICGPAAPSHADPHAASSQSVAGLATDLTVGPGKTFALPSDAARQAKPGDIIQIFPGRYVDCANWDADDLVIEGVGPGVIIADKVCDDKGLFVTRGRNITVRNITFTSAHAGNHNGSGIRAEGANLTVEASRFIADEDGILAGDNPASTIIVINSYFSGNGNCIAACAHGIYANHIALLHVENSHFVEQHVGHHIKSRAARTEIMGNTVQDGPFGSASYLVDLPNAGSAVISDNMFEKGPRSENKLVAISIGGEKSKGLNPAGDITIENNVFSNDAGIAVSFVKNYTDRVILLRANRFSGTVTPLLDAADAGKDQIAPTPR
jgi:hypothetical protein